MKCKKKKMNSFIVQIVMVAIFIIFIVGVASAGCIGDETGTDFECGDTVNESCTFNGDMCCDSGHGLIIGANGITIDGAGYTLDGVSSDACDGFGVQRSGIYGKSCSDIVIKDLEIKNFCNGIYFRYTEDDGIPLERITIENCDIHHNGGDTGGDNSVHGIKLIGVFDSVILHCRIHHNTGEGDSCEGGGNGIFLKGISGYGAWGNIISENEIYGNKKGGFFTKMMCKDTEVSYNKLWGNGQGGIILRCMKSENHDIHDNEIWDNYGSGIFVGGPDNIVRDNIVKNNKNGSEYGGLGTGEHGGQGSGSPGKYGMGICMGRNDGSHNNEIISNEVCGNEGVDIEVCPTCEGNSGEENTCDTTFNYDDEGTTGCTYRCEGDSGEVGDDTDGDDVSDKPDLTIVENSEEWVVLANKTYNITYTIKNIGDALAPENTISIIIDEIEVATDFVQELAVGENYTKTLGPFTMSEDEDTIKLCADVENDVEEGDETNNCLENVFDYLKMPDLTVVEKTEEWVDLVNKTYNVIYTIKNIGNSEAEASNTSIVIDGLLVKTEPVGTLALGENYTKTLGPFTMTGDSGTIRVCADKDGVVVETDEGNNCRENVFNFNASAMPEPEKTEEQMNKTTPTSVETVEKTPVPTRTSTPTPSLARTPTPSPPAPGFELSFAIAGLLAIAYVLMKRRGKKK
jgi:archaellum component FlaG (FlaF/FlaG flagellin family)